MQLLAFLEPYGTHSYLGMFIFLLICGMGVPIPEDIILIVGGILSASGVCNFWVTLVVCMAGVLIGDGVIFLVGRRYGARVKRTWLFRRMMTEKVDAKIVGVFSKYGDRVVFMGRFMPGLRMPIFLSAGIYHVPVWKFFMLDGLAAVISVPLWIWVGYVFGDNLPILEKRMRQFQWGFYAILIGIILFFIIGALLRRRILRQDEVKSPLS